MIHAMMSEAGSGGRERSHVVSTFGALAADQQLAEAEARRILAVTEPEKVQPIRTVCHEQAHVYAHRGAFGYMADALGAFLAAPDPAEYLAGVSR